MQVVADRYIVGLGVLIRADRGSRSGNTGSCFAVLSGGNRPFRLRTPDEARGILCTKAIVPPGARYVIEGDDVQIATALVEADGILGRRASYELDATTRRGPSAWVEVGERLVPSDLWAHVATGDGHTAFRRLATALDRKQRGLAYAGPRVRRATDLVESKLPTRVPLGELAGAVDLTLEQLTRTLLDEVGLAARPFVRWLRLRRYAGLVSAGATVDEAARASGYRRRSELTDDLRRLVGFTERDVDACQHWKPLPEVSATAA